MIQNDAGEVLIVKPVYRDGWLLPGGLVEQNESPRAGCERELLEELGLPLKVGNLLAVDHVAGNEDLREGFMFLFGGPQLADSQAARIRLQAEELSEMAFVAPARAVGLLAAPLALRLQHGWLALGDGRARYLENGLPV